MTKTLMQGLTIGLIAFSALWCVAVVWLACWLEGRDKRG